MILCKYFDEHGLDALHDLHLKVSHPLEINDPFEFAPYFAEQEGDKIVAQRTHEGLVESRQRRLKKIRVLCFSNPHVEGYAEKEILLWAHYANGHKGVRIFFNTDKMQFSSSRPLLVTYSQERKQLLVSDFIHGNKEKVFKDLTDALLAKSDIWRYEAEYRYIFDLEMCFARVICQKIVYFINVDADAIMRVDIGVNAGPKFRADVLAVLDQDRFKHVEIYDAVMHKSLYSLDYNRVNKDVM
jgi:hypothetical protein